MPEIPQGLGKLVSVHGTSPAYLQRGAIVAILSFIFFIAMLIAFYIREQFGYFVLSTAFLVVYVFTMIGWWMQKRNIVNIYENGLSYKKFTAGWDELASAPANGKTSAVVLTNSNGETVTIPATINGIESIRQKIASKIVV